MQFIALFGKGKHDRTEIQFDPKTGIVLLRA